MNLSNALGRSGQRPSECGLLETAASVLANAPERGQAALIYFNLGNCLRDRGRSEDALRQYGSALRVSDREFRQAIENAAITNLDLGRGERAFELAQELVAGWPDVAAGFKLLGVIEARRGRFEHAAAQLQRAAELAPNDPAIRNLLSRVDADLAKRTPISQFGS